MIIEPLSIGKVERERVTTKELRWNQKKQQQQQQQQMSTSNKLSSADRNRYYLLSYSLQYYTNNRYNIIPEGNWTPLLPSRR